MYSPRFILGECYVAGLLPFGRLLCCWFVTFRGDCYVAGLLPFGEIVTLPVRYLLGDYVSSLLPIGGGFVTFLEYCYFVVLLPAGGLLCCWFVTFWEIFILPSLHHL